MYYIYHIPGVKIGCTDNVQERISAQKFINYEVLEEHTDAYIASDREIALQKQYGYPVDKIPYWKTIQQLTHNPKRLEAIQNSELYKAVRIECGKRMGKVRGQQCKESGFMSDIGKKYGPIMGKKNVESGHLQNISSEAGKLGGKIGGKKNVESGHLENVRSKIRVCPYCTKTIKGGNYFKWHGDKCKAKPQ